MDEDYARIWAARCERLAELRHEPTTAERLGLPEGSLTARDLAAGLITLEEAQRRAEIITHRHEHTDYDDLLRRGIDRDTAREVI